MIPIMVIGAYAVAINNLPIPAYRQLMKQIFGDSWTYFGVLVYNITVQLSAIMLVFSICYHIAEWYNIFKKKQIHTNICGMVGVACYLAMSIPVQNADSIPFAATGITGLVGAIIVSVLSSELFIHWYVKIKQSSKIPDALVSQALGSLMPAIVLIFGFAAIRMGLYFCGIGNSLNDIINNILQLPFKYNKGLFHTAFIYSISSHFMWLLGIHGNNVLETVVINVFPQTGSSIISKTFFDVFVYMGGCGTTLALLLAFVFCGEYKRNRRFFFIGLSNSIFNINEPLIFGIPIVFNPIYAVPFILTPCIMFLTTYLAMSAGLVPPVTREIWWTTPIFISGYLSTGSFCGVFLQIINLAIATAIYVPFVKLSMVLSEMNFKNSYQDLVEYITTKYSVSSHNILKRTDEIGAVSRQLANQLENAIDNGELYLNYQPIVDVERYTLYSVEALLRWKHPLYGMIHPMLIIALAEEIKLIDKLGLWIIKQAMIQRAAWNKEGISDFHISVNVSCYQLEVLDFHNQVFHILNDLKVLPQQLQIEITETVALTESYIAHNNLMKLTEAGVSVSMDDFGAGHSSLLYLCSIPIHAVKIDGSLSRSIVNYPINLNIISTIYDLCQLLHINTIVEYVENQEQLDKLMQVGNFLIQGYLFSQPIEGDMIPSFIRDLNPPIYERKHK
ncbi:MAG: EAL domain-containing protein [Hungatella sp.]|nr:EAL domain-containing protein [Hungatella sp.]